MTFTTAPATVVVDGGHELAEGGRWIDDRYVYVDILTGRLFELREGTGPATPGQLTRLDVPLGALAHRGAYTGHRGWVWPPAPTSIPSAASPACSSRRTAPRRTSRARA